MKNPSFIKKLSYFFILALVLFFILEAVTSIIFYQKYGGTRSSTVTFFTKAINRLANPPVVKDLSAHQLRMRPDADKEMVRDILNETTQALRIEYAPWVMYKTANFAGKYVNAQDFIRKSIPEFSLTAKDSALTIYFFGGSTMYGVSVTDNETIPSYFAEICKVKKLSKNIRVVNYGVPTYFSYQELMLFIQLLQKDTLPKIAVFFDGLNDFLAINETRYRHPMLNHYYQTIFSNSDQLNHAREFDYSFQFSSKQPSKDSLAFVCDQLLHSYLQTQLQIRTIANAYNIHSMFFIQPVPFYQYPSLLTDSVADKINRPQFGILYPQLEKKAAGDSTFYFLGNMLKNEKVYPFADGYHYSPQFNRKIANAMFEKILPLLK